MAIPNVNVAVNNTGVGIITAGTGPLPANVSGWCSQGPTATPTAIGAAAIGALTNTFGVGSAVELAAAILSNGAPSVVVTRIFHGAVVSTFTNVGGGPTVTGSGNPMGLYGTATSTGSTGPIILISTGGVLGTGQFEVSLDGGVTYTAAQTLPAGGSYIIPNTGITVTFAAGTYILNATYTGAITTAVGSSSSVQQLPVKGQSLVGSGAVSMDATNNPQDAYNVVILIEATGVIGVGQYSFSLDGGLTFSGSILIPSSGPSVLGSSGVAIDWANTGGGGSTSGFEAGESYIFTTLPPAFTSTDVINVAQFITGNKIQWDWMHIVGRPTSISNATGLFAALATQGGTWFAANRYSWFVMETPSCTETNNTSAAIVAAFSALASDYVSVGGGDFNCVSAISGAEIQRNASWAASIWGAPLKVGIDLAAPALGNLPFVADLLWDDNQTPAFDAGRFTSLRSIPTLDGSYITNARIMCGTQSDIVYWQSRRCLNVACGTAYQTLVKYLSTPILVNATTGTIDPKAATAIQNAVMRAINQALAGQITGSSAIVDQTNDVLITQQLNITIGIIPLFYPKFIDATIGYVNPAVSTQ